MGESEQIETKGWFMLNKALFVPALKIEQTFSETLQTV
jgi:hypothetical protein